MNYSRPSTCQEDMEPFEGDPSTRGISEKPQKQATTLGNFHHQYLAELLLNGYGYGLMVKSVS